MKKGVFMFVAVFLMSPSVHLSLSAGSINKSEYASRRAKLIEKIPE